MSSVYHFAKLSAWYLELYNWYMAQKQGEQAGDYKLRPQMSPELVLGTHSNIQAKCENVLLGPCSHTFIANENTSWVC